MKNLLSIVMPTSWQISFRVTRGNTNNSNRQLNLNAFKRTMSFINSSLSKLMLSLICLLSSSQVLAVSNYDISAAKKFAEIYEKERRISPARLKKDYLNIQSHGLMALANRIQGEGHLLKAINSSRSDYQQAINVCLPVALELKTDVVKTVSKVAAFLSTNDNLSVDIVFGANNTAATATPQGIVIALEAACQGITSKEQAKTALLEYVAHEVVHVFQYRNTKRTDFNFTLLELSLIEGAADYFSEIAMQQQSNLQIKRELYGESHETEVWKKFSKTMHSHVYQPWLYSAPEGKMPTDMGYWVGKRIIKNLYENSPDKNETVKDVLIMHDASEILATSRYGQFQRTNGTSR